MGINLTEHDEGFTFPVNRPTGTRAATSTSGIQAVGVGGWFRIGNRPNEGHAEMSACVYLPDGRVAFDVRPSVDRPPTS